MILYLLSSSLCLLAAFGFYKGWLENERMPRFKRAYLLGSLFFSLLAPVLPLDFSLHPEQASTLVGRGITGLQTLTELPAKSASPAPDGVEVPFWWWLYGSVTAVMLLRFGRNLYLLGRQIATNPRQAYGGATLVLLPEATLPYTFLHYLFVSETAYRRGEIEPELFTHELAHVRQRHSLDVLLIEFLRCLAPFHPVLGWMKQAMQLNHEFLADEAVNKTHDARTQYQQLLLSKLTLTPGMALSSTFSFGTTKQRFLMMTKTTSRPKAGLLSTAAAFLFGGMLLLLGIRTAAQTPQTPPRVKAVQPRPSSETDVQKMERLYGDKLVALPGVNVERKKFSELSAQEKPWVRLIPPLPRQRPTEAQLSDWKNSRKFGLWIDGKRVPNSRLNDFRPADFDNYSVSKLEKNAINYGKHYFQVDLMTQAAYTAYRKEREQSPFLVLVPPTKTR